MEFQGTLFKLSQEGIKMYIILSALLFIFGQAEYYDVVEWKADTIEEMYAALSECNELTEQALNVLQCELIIVEG